ncbi:3084_t:CDS:1, partial [Dentiscutata erythropus]
MNDQEIEDYTHDENTHDEDYIPDENFTYDENDEPVFSSNEIANSTNSTPVSTNQLDESPVWLHFERSSDYAPDSN